MRDLERADIEAILRDYARARSAFRQATWGMTERQALASPELDEWSVAQIVTHLWTVDGHALVTFTGADPPAEVVMEPQNPESFAPRLDAFEARRAQSSRRCGTSHRSGGTRSSPFGASSAPDGNSSRVLSDMMRTTCGRSRRRGN